MSRPLVSPEALARALSIRDLTEPAKGPHAMQVLLHDLVSALCRAWGCRSVVVRGSPIVSVHDNYDALGYPPDGAARDARYSRYVTDDTLLRTQMSAMIPGALKLHAGDDVLLVAPGLVYRRDTVDRLHTGEPHQVDLWRLGVSDATTREMCELVVNAALPGREWAVTSTTHPYTTNGLQLDVRDDDGQWVELGECGDSRLCPGLAMGLGLDRLLMLRKGIPDIRLLRSEDPRAQEQLLDLAPWRTVSKQPAVTRDLSLAVHPSRAETEVLGDRLREALGPARTALVESIYIVSRTEGRTLPPLARARIGIEDEQVNVLLRVVLRAIDRTLTTAECNQLRNDIYLALHEGRAHQLI